MMNDDQFAKLPRYAQNEIVRLRREVDYFRAQHRAIAAGETDTAVRDYTALGGPLRRYLPDGSFVEFGTDWHGDAAVTVRWDAERGHAEVRTTHGALTVRPTSGNSITVAAEKW